MYREPPVAETLQYFVLNTVSAFLCAAAHNALYFMLGLTNWAFHFMHYFCTFLMLLVSYWCGLIPKKHIPWKEILPISLTQLGATVATCVIHNGGKDGALYTLRFTDFLVTIFGLFFAHKLLQTREATSWKRKPFLIFIAVSSSAAWMEWTLIDYTWTARLMTPLLTVSSALHVVLTFQKQQKLNCHTDMLMLYITGMTSAVLFIPSIIFTHDSFTKEMMSTSSAWEIIDLALLAMAMVFMVGLVYSKYWLMQNCTPESFLMMRHAKYTLGAVGQWFIQNLSHAALFDSVGKLCAFCGLSVYGLRRYAEYKASQKFDNVATNGVGKI